jgi:type I site-specific restriction-modification system R (restriction) subunit
MGGGFSREFSKHAIMIRLFPPPSLDQEETEKKSFRFYLHAYIYTHQIHKKNILADVVNILIKQSALTLHSIYRGPLFWKKKVRVFFVLLINDGVVE